MTKNLFFVLVFKQVNMDTCLICHKDFSDGEGKCVVTRGLETLIKVSKERNDDKHKIWSNKSAVELHVECRKKYTLKKNGTSYSNVGTNENENTHNFSPQKSKMRKLNNAFDFLTKCFICGDEADLSKEKKKPINRRTDIRIVQDPKVQENITEMIIGSNCEIAKAMQRRVFCVDLIAEQARYHRKCYSNLVLVGVDKTSNRPVGRPEYIIIMETFFDYIDNSIDSVFTMEELTNVLGKFFIFLLNN